MAKESRSDKGGIRFGDVGDKVEVRAGGDIVGGDKTSTTTNTTGFAGNEHKQEFEAQLDQMREMLRALKAEIEASATLSSEEKEEIAGEVLQRLKAVKEVKESTADLPPGKPASPDVVAVVEQGLQRAAGAIDAFQTVAARTVGIAGKIGQFAVRYVPLVLSARRLFGLP